MWSLFRAEWKKTIGNRWLVGCLMGLFPMAALVVSLFIFALVIFDSEIQERVANNPTPWTDASLFFWAIPNSIIGRLLIVAFTAAMFAGEYQWGTWKNLMQRRDRISLIVTKFITLGIFVILSFILTSLIWVIGRGVIQLVAGGTYPPAFDEIPSDYWNKLLLQMFNTFVSTLILSGVAALVALVTRSIIASIIVGMVAAIFDGFVGVVLLLFYSLTEQRFFPGLYRFTVSYNVDNLLNIATSGEPSPVLGNINVQNNFVFGTLKLDPPLAGNPLGISLLIMLLWAALMICLSVYSFYRQDMTA